MQERWIDKFERPRLRALGTLKRRAEEAMTRWEHRRADGSGIADVVGTVVGSDRPTGSPLPQTPWLVPGDH
jgi:hypothetical protein